jgi:SRSO17 transposase
VAPRPRNLRQAPDRYCAGIPDEVELATKPRQLIAMLARALEAGVPFAWVTADEIYGQAGYLRDWLEDRGAAYVLAIRCVDAVATAGGERVVAEQAIAALPAQVWGRLSVGAGAHGPTMSGPGRTHSHKCRCNI